MTAETRYPFSATQRLRRRKDFAHVYDRRSCRHAGPLRIYAAPNGLAWSRLGTSVSAKVGPAVRRNRIKRRLRNAFRLLQHELPAGYDFVVVVRRHDPLSVAAYQKHLASAAAQLHAHWKRT
ncbi:MAG: ribonuclease P protein component [Phycisphaeraceae bacterium]|nr:ribonuclease P protein component [Phycisphaeraceae bacterium]